LHEPNGDIYEGEVGEN